MCICIAVVPYVEQGFPLPVQVVGSKTAWLAPPDLAGAMSPFNRPQISSTLHPDQDRHRHPSSNNLDPLLSNTSTIDVFPEDSRPSSDRHPVLSHADQPDVTTLTESHAESQNALLRDFEKEVVPRAMSVTVRSGDMLFIPPGWWHALRSEENSFSVSMWF